MGKYNFDKLTDRRRTDCMKWDVADGVLPMWVADMDFDTAPAVKEAIVKRATHGIYGYSLIPDRFLESVADFWQRRHGYRFDTSDMIYVSGIVAAISSVVRKLTYPAEKVLIQPPVFNLFYNSVYNNGRYIVENDLVLKNGRYEIDFEDLERKLSDPQLTLFILCNPHNPVGRVYTRDELARIGELCHKYGVTVLSDEIHCEFTSPKGAYTPFAAASDICRDISITCVSASKAFNLAGLQAAVAIVHDPALRHKVNRGLNTDEVAEPNCFSMSAYTAAFSECDEWLDELIDYVNANKEFATEYIKKNVPILNVPKSCATYLLWIDASAVGISSPELSERLKAEYGIYLSDGLEYGECGRYFLRMNLATSRANVEEGLKRLKSGIENIMKEKE